MATSGDVNRTERFKTPAAFRIVLATFFLSAFWIVANSALEGARGATSGSTPAASDDGGETFWSFLPLSDSEPPSDEKDEWSRTPIDRFVLAKMTEQGLQPGGTADRRTLIRRAYFDLIGLPPTYEEVEQFVQDDSPDAYERLIDRLLESPQHGERWARHWLDIARYAESMGFEHDFDYPYAYRYRDFVIKALNADLPFNDFMRWQIAGDEIAPEDPMALAATAFLTVGAFPTSVTEAEFEKARYDQLDDMAGTTSVAFLGLTLGCARCHDHKYDPITSRDYYRFLATFGTTLRGQVEVNPESGDETVVEYEGELERCEDQIAFFEIERLPALLQRHLEVAPADDPVRKAIDAGNTPEARKLISAMNAWWGKHIKERDTHVAAGIPNKLRMQVSSEGLPKPWHDADDRGFPHFYEKTYFLSRGDVHQKQEEVSAGFLPFLISNGVDESHWKQKPPQGARTSYRRRALADWLADSENGAGRLTARVMVNRLWQHHFGRGIVGTPNDFGMQGERPTHPELLDWLATKLIESNWQLRPIHKLIMTSQAYMQASNGTPEAVKIDPQNKWLARQNVRRLEAEAIRDAMLATSGELDLTMFGPGTLKETMKRRTIYFRLKRSRVIPILQVFDLPEPLTSHAQRPTTTVSPQALMLLNNDVCRSWADAFAARIRPELDTSTASAVTAAYRLAFQRQPSDDELLQSCEFIESQTSSYREANQLEPELTALSDFCQSMFCLNEFVYVD